MVQVFSARRPRSIDRRWRSMIRGATGRQPELSGNFRHLDTMISGCCHKVAVASGVGQAPGTAARSATALPQAKQANRLIYRIPLASPMCSPGGPRPPLSLGRERFHSPASFPKRCGALVLRGNAIAAVAQRYKLHRLRSKRGRPARSTDRAGPPLGVIARAPLPQAANNAQRGGSFLFSSWDCGARL